MTREEAVEALTRLEISNFRSGKSYITEAFVMAINALRTEPCEDCISRQAAIDALIGWETDPLDEDIERELRKLPSVQPEPKKGYISIADVMSVFDDFMRGEVDEDGTETFLEMLKDKAESEDKE